jgi:hypothetical protein
MNVIYLRQARRLFDNPGVPRGVVRHNIRAWVRSVRMLGDQWLLAQPIGRKS